MDGNGTLFGTLQGNTREVLHKFTVDLPKKHGRGGQSALRFARLRMEKRHNYVRKVAECAVEMFIKNDKVTVAGLILAGSADFKTELGQSDMFDQRLQAKMVKTVDISYGGENGFNQAIELAADALANVKFIQEKKLIGGYFDEISQDTGKYVFGVKDTLQALEMGAVETLICWENLDIIRYRLKNAAGEFFGWREFVPYQSENLFLIKFYFQNCYKQEALWSYIDEGIIAQVWVYLFSGQFFFSEEKILNLRPDEEKDKTHFTDKETGQDMEIVETMPLLEWFANNY
ncbi:unnamed protein product, partial [Cylicostephanus goldi]